jgi:tetratricopeptide repeat protein 8
MLSDQGGVFINIDRLDLKRYAKRPALAKVLCDYMLYYEHNPKKALELASEATIQSGYRDWWWKARLGKCYYQLGLYRDAEKQVGCSSSGSSSSRCVHLLRKQDSCVRRLGVCADV